MNSTLYPAFTSIARARAHVAEFLNAGVFSMMNAPGALGSAALSALMINCARGSSLLLLALADEKGAHGGVITITPTRPYRFSIFWVALMSAKSVLWISASGWMPRYVFKASLLLSNAARTLYPAFFIPMDVPPPPANMSIAVISHPLLWIAATTRSLVLVSSGALSCLGSLHSPLTTSLRPAVPGASLFEYISMVCRADPEIPAAIMSSLSSLHMTSACRGSLLRASAAPTSFLYSRLKSYSLSTAFHRAICGCLICSDFRIH